MYETKYKQLDFCVLDKTLSSAERMRTGRRCFVMHLFINLFRIVTAETLPTKTENTMFLSNIPLSILFYNYGTPGHLLVSLKALYRCSLQSMFY